MGLEGKLFNLITDIHEKLTSCLIVKDCFFPKIRNKSKISDLNNGIQCHTSQCNKAGKGI